MFAWISWLLMAVTHWDFGFRGCFGDEFAAAAGAVLRLVSVLIDVIAGGVFTSAPASCRGQPQSLPKQPNQQTSMQTTDGCILYMPCLNSKSQTSEELEFFFKGIIDRIFTPLSVTTYWLLLIAGGFQDAREMKGMNSERSIYAKMVYYIL